MRTLLVISQAHRNHVSISATCLMHEIRGAIFKKGPLGWPTVCARHVLRRLACTCHLVCPINLSHSIKHRPRRAVTCSAATMWNGQSSLSRCSETPRHATPHLDREGDGVQCSAFPDRRCGFPVPSVTMAAGRVSVARGMCDSVLSKTVNAGAGLRVDASASAQQAPKPNSTPCDPQTVAIHLISSYFVDHHHEPPTTPCRYSG